MVARLISSCKKGAAKLKTRKIKVGSLPQSIIEEVITMLDRLGILEKPLAIRSSASAEDSAKAPFFGRFRLCHDS